MSKPDHSNTSNVQKQTTDEWLANYNGTQQGNKLLSSQVIDIRPKTEHEELRERVKNAGIASIRSIANSLLINTESYITDKMKSRILHNLNQLASIAEPDTGEALYIYSGYRTLFSNKKPCIAVVFNEIYTGEIAERFFNIDLRNTKGNSFKTGANCEFRIVGDPNHPREGSFIKLWMNGVKWIPDNRPSHIHRYVNVKFSGLVVSCAKPVPHHGNTKLTNVKYEGHLFKFT